MGMVVERKDYLQLKQIAGRYIEICQVTSIDRAVTVMEAIQKRCQDKQTDEEKAEALREWMKENHVEFLVELLS